MSPVHTIGSIQIFRENMDKISNNISKVLGSLHNFYELWTYEVSFFIA